MLDCCEIWQRFKTRDLRERVKLREREKQKDRERLGDINLQRSAHTDSRLFPFSNSCSESVARRPITSHRSSQSRIHYLGWLFPQLRYRTTHPCHDLVFATTQTCQWKQTEWFYGAGTITTAEPGRPFRTYDAPFSLRNKCAIPSFNSLLFHGISRTCLLDTWGQCHFKYTFL